MTSCSSFMPMTVTGCPLLLLSEAVAFFFGGAVLLVLWLFEPGAFECTLHKAFSPRLWFTSIEGIVRLSGLQTHDRMLFSTVELESMPFSVAVLLRISRRVYSFTR